jgi:hypothetical protein
VHSQLLRQTDQVGLQTFRADVVIALSDAPQRQIDIRLVGAFSFVSAAAALYASLLGQLAGNAVSSAVSICRLHPGSFSLQWSLHLLGNIFFPRNDTTSVTFYPGECDLVITHK